MIDGLQIQSIDCKESNVRKLESKTNSGCRDGVTPPSRLTIYLERETSGPEFIAGRLGRQLTATGKA